MDSKYEVYFLTGTGYRYEIWIVQVKKLYLVNPENSCYVSRNFTVDNQKYHNQTNVK